MKKGHLEPGVGGRVVSYWVSSCDPKCCSGVETGQESGQGHRQVQERQVDRFINLQPNCMDLKAFTPDILQHF